MLLNPGNPAHAKAAGRLRDEPGIWLTTVTPSGQPQSSLVWFWWDGGEFLIYGSRSGPKTPNIQAHPQVSLHLDSNGQGGGVVTIEGVARIEPAAPPAGAAAYLAKYGDRIASMGWDADVMARDYPHVIKVTATRARVW